jgi:anti-sigma B factor antagonist
MVAIFGERESTASQAVVIVDASLPCPTLRLVGDIDLLTAPALREGLLELLESGAARRIVIDLSEVTFFDANPLGVLVAGRQRAHALGIDLVLRGASDRVLRVLQLIGLEELFILE